MHIALQARDPARNIHRAWSISAAPDLFGAWLVHIRYGRIGAEGRLISRSFPTEAATHAHIRRALARRASAPRRIGVAYCRTDDVT
jgi:predicted DNA-binding WGR domain protein